MRATWINDDGTVRYLPEPYTFEDRPLWFHTAGLQETASGYGARLRTARVVRLPDGRTRRVYLTIYSNVGTAWINLDGRLWVVREY